MNDTPVPSVSVLVPISETYGDIKALYLEYREAIAKITDRFELIFSTSSDHPLIIQTVQELAAEDKKLKLLELSRDYGEGTMLQAAFDNISCDIVLVLPAYKQVKLDNLPVLFDKLDQADIVLGRRWPRKDSNFKQAQTKLFSQTIKLLTGKNYSDTGCSVMALKREAASELKLYGDQHRFIHLLADDIGYSSVEVDMEQADENITRKTHSPGVYLRRILDLLTIVFITKFKKKPLRFFGIIGSISMAIGLLGLLMLSYQRIFLDIGMSDRPMLVLLALFLVLGIQLIGIGLIGETITFTHSKDQKEYRIREIVGKQP